MTSLQNFNWRKSRRGVCITLWHHNVKNSIKRGHKPPEYTQKELIDWILSHKDFEKLYSNWVDSNYLRDLAVSIDRLDDSKGYAFNNIQLITFRENYLKSHQGFRDKTLFNPTLLNDGHVKVYQYNTKGHFIKDFISLSEAARQLNVRHQLISRAIKVGRYAYGYFWCTDKTKNEFLLELPKLLLDIHSKTKFHQNKILKIDKLSGKTLATYDSIKCAAIAENISEHIIRQITKGALTRAKLSYIFIKECNE